MARSASGETLFDTGQAGVDFVELTHQHLYHALQVGDVRPRLPARGQDLRAQQVPHIVYSNLVEKHTQHDGDDGNAGHETKLSIAHALTFYRARLLDSFRKFSNTEG